MLLPKQHIKNIFDSLHPSQYQPCGMDITLGKLFLFKDAGRIDFDNSTRRISDVEELPFDKEIHLNPGAYKVVFKEYVKIPKDVAGFCFPRSSLLRCGATLECAVWDPGYEGRSEALLVVFNPKGIVLTKGAKIGQMVFVKLAEVPEDLYQGVYKGENK